MQATDRGRYAPGSNEYARFRAAAILGGDEFNAALGQRFDQSIGRGARGSGDHCVVAITGRDLISLISWIGRESNLRFLTRSTNAQLAIGGEISRDIEDSAARASRTPTPSSSPSPVPACPTSPG
jgi:hypothetical protein